MKLLGEFKQLSCLLQTSENDLIEIKSPSDYIHRTDLSSFFLFIAVLHLMTLIDVI